MGTAKRRMRCRGVGRIFSAKALVLYLPGAKMAYRGACIEGWMMRFVVQIEKQAKIRHSRSRLPRFAALYCTWCALPLSFSAARSPGSFF